MLTVAKHLSNVSAMNQVFDLNVVREWTSASDEDSVLPPFRAVPKAHVDFLINLEFMNASHV